MVQRGEQAHQFVLAAVGVLVFVDKQIAEAVVVKRADCLVVVQEADGFEQKVIEVERVGLTEAALVLFVEQRHARGLRILGRLVEVGGRFLVALGVADARQHGAVLHEFLVQAVVTEEGFDDRKLVVLVVDGEAGGEAGPDLGEFRAIAAEEADAEGMKGGNPGRGTSGFGDQAVHPLAHLVGCLVCKCDSQNRPGGNPMGRDQVGDAVSDDACLAAARPGQDQKRTVEMADSFLLRRVQP